MGPKRVPILSRGRPAANAKRPTSTVLKRSSVANPSVASTKLGLGKNPLAKSLAEELRQPRTLPVDLETVDVAEEEPDLAEDTDSSSGAEVERAATKTALKIRARRCSTQVRAGGGADASVLLDGSVSQRTRLAYREALQAFIVFAEVQKLAVGMAEETDLAMVLFLTMLFSKGYDLNVGEKTVAALMFVFPRFSRFGDLKIPRVHRALRGWRRLAPPKSRVPLTFYVVAAISALLVADSQVSMALWCLISFGTYFRPGSMMQLRRSSFLKPVTGMDQYWKILTHQSELCQRGKTGTTDDTLLWDVQDLLWLAKAFAMLVEPGIGLSDEEVWPFHYADLAKAVAKAGNRLGLKVVPYQFRHSGASWDAAKKYRPLLEIQGRGGWRSTSSVMRYEKSGRMLREYARMSATRRHYCEVLAGNLQSYIVHGHKVPAPP